MPAWTLLVSPLAALLLLLVATQSPDGRLHVWVLDVGQGDAIFLRTPRGHTALIDGGPGATSLLNGLGSRMPFWQHDIDLLVLTHPHDDHVMGLVDVLSRYRVSQVVQTQFTATVGASAEWLRQVSMREIPVHYARHGDTISFEGEPDVSLRVMSPTSPTALAEKRGGDLNNTSIVLKVDYGGEGILLEGDAQVGAEGAMVASESGALNSSILKVGHHGSSTSSSPGFLEMVRPRVAIISVGAGNSFGHPAAETINALRGAGAAVYTTEERGTVEIIVEKGRAWVRSDR